MPPAPPHRPTRSRLLGKLSLETAEGMSLTDTRIRLLEAIAAQGSLSQAAKTVPLSYKAAWDALDAVNHLADEPLVARQTGGRHGGGTVLTPAGHRLVTLYRAMAHTQQQALDRLQTHSAGTGADPSGSAAAPEASDEQSLRRWIHRLGVKTSARNQLAGTVSALTRAHGMVDVRLALAAGLDIVAAVTRDSAEAMALSAGVELLALVKAPWVGLQARPPRKGAGRNIVPGRLSSLRHSAERVALTLDTPTGHRIASVMTATQVAQRGLRTGLPAWAVFSTDSVILARFD